MSHEWERGYNSGYDAGMAAMIREQLRQQGEPALAQVLSRSGSPKPKRKRSQSPKQKLLSSMADKAWKSYKRKTPKGKKTYIAIRAQVSRSQAYKKKARRL